MKDREDLHETRDQLISRSVKDNKESWILTGRYRRCNSQEATGFSGISPNVDCGCDANKFMKQCICDCTMLSLYLSSLALGL